MAFWWVNHKQTRNHEVRGGYLWSPMRNANGAINQTYENMIRVRVGDVVFSYANGEVGAIGHVTEAAVASPKPTEFGAVGDYWSNEGWLVSVYFTPSPRALRPKAHLDAIGKLLPARHSPLQQNGNGNQGCYLAGISDALGHLLLALMDVQVFPDFSTGAYVQDAGINHDAIDDIHEIEEDTSIPETQRVQLAKARIGQGLFRKRVLLVDPLCRVTGVSDQRLLIASHIKPWRDANNAERVNGYNGMMLSPHVDALFDEHLISFEDDGKMLVHTSLPRDVLERWSIDPAKRVATFRPEQSAFLAYHRKCFVTG
jgi:putative restriction endonuclease